MFKLINLIKMEMYMNQLLYKSDLTNLMKFQDRS